MSLINDLYFCYFQLNGLLRVFKQLPEASSIQSALFVVHKQYLDPPCCHKLLSKENMVATRRSAKKVRAGCCCRGDCGGSGVRDSCQGVEDVRWKSV